MRRLGVEGERPPAQGGDRKSTRLNSSHRQISYAVFCLQKKNWHCAQSILARFHDIPARIVIAPEDQLLPIRLKACPYVASFRVVVRDRTPSSCRNHDRD